MADDIGLGEVLEGDAVDAGKEPLDLDQPGLGISWQIHLRLVAGDDHARAHSQAREQHLHLHRGGVLRFIDDDERLWLIDWDYAGFNSPLFDLGGLAANSQLSPEHESFVLAYGNGRRSGAGRRPRVPS